MTAQERDLERWLAANARARPLAVILGTSWNALSFARSLGRRRVPVLVLESRRKLGSYTRYGKVLAVPHVDDDPETWIRLLGFVGDRVTNSPVLVPTGDPDTVFLSRYEGLLQPRFRFVVPARETAEQIVNKRLQYAIAKEAGIPVPRTYFPESAEEVRELSTELSFPCLVKPYVSYIALRAVGRQLLVARSAGELVSGYARLAARDVPAMVQEIVPGGDRALFGYLALWDRDGRELAWLTKRKLRQNPPGFGTGAVQITAEAPEVAALSRRLLQAMNYRGFVGVEFKSDATSGKHYLMEINPRTVAGNQMAIDAGVDFPWIGYRYLTGAEGGVERRRGFQVGVKHLNEELDTQAYLTLRESHGMTVRQWARSIRGTRSRAIWAWDDPRPFMILTRRLVRRGIIGVTGRSPAARGFRKRVRIAWRRPSATSPGAPR
jgi:predicted ATP-grasp superfamily ATP-dependent carboligase